MPSELSGWWHWRVVLPVSPGACASPSLQDLKRIPLCLGICCYSQARLLVWHVWMVGRLQLTAAAEVAAVTRGMWSWLLRCATHLAAALGLLAMMAMAAAGGAFVAAGAWTLAGAVRQLRTAAVLEVRVRRVWAPAALQIVDTVMALAGPLVRPPTVSPPEETADRPEAKAGAKSPEAAGSKEGGKEGAEVPPGERAGAREPGHEAKREPERGPQEGGGGKTGAQAEGAKAGQPGGAEVSRPKGMMAAAASSAAPLLDFIRVGQAYISSSLTALRSFVAGLVPK